MSAFCYTKFLRSSRKLGLTMEALIFHLYYIKICVEEHGVVLNQLPHSPLSCI